MAFELRLVLGKYCLVLVSVLSDDGLKLLTLPYSLTEDLYCLCSGPTSCKSLGILLILSFNRTTWAVLLSSFVGNSTNGSVTGYTGVPLESLDTGYPLRKPGK